MYEGAEGSSLRRRKEAFHVHVQAERDPVKQEKLKEFLQYIDKALDPYELDWFWEKAIQTADAARALLDQTETRRLYLETERKRWTIRFVILWSLFLMFGAIIIGTGIRTIYVYKSSDGTKVASDAYMGYYYSAGRSRMPLEFSHETKSFENHPAVRFWTVLIGGVILGGFNLFKMSNL